MSFFSASPKETKVTKVDLARQKIKRYQETRAEIVQQYLKTILEKIEQEIMKTAEMEGKSTITYDWSDIKIPKKDDAPEILFSKLKPEELEQIREGVSKWLETEEFEYKIPDINYYRNKVTVTW